MSYSKSMLTNIIAVLKQLAVSDEGAGEIERHLLQLADSYNADFEDLFDIYNKMMPFYMEVKRMGGEEEYVYSDVLWLKQELELLFACYTFFQKCGVSVLTISKALSNEGLNVFPKTKSQLQNTYYKLKNGQLPFDVIFKQKPGRKHVQKAKEETALGNDIENSSRVEKMEHTQLENLCDPVRKSKQNLVQLLSGMIQNFQRISGSSAESEQQIYHFIDAVYTLSSMAAKHTETQEHIDSMEAELVQLRLEEMKWKREREELIADIQGLASIVSRFTDSTDVEQLRGLSQFVAACKSELAKLEGMGSKGEEQRLAHVRQ